MWILLVVALLAACSKTEKAPANQTPAAKAQPHVQEGDVAAKFNPANLPPAGTAPDPVTVTKELDSMWNVPLKTLQGKDAKLADFKGKALMLVNVASKCGNTPQYATLEALQKKYEPKGFTVIGFPCNQFGGQEPGSSEDIATFCATNYGITFPIMEKLEVNGPNRHEVYKALTPIADTDGKAGDIHWNFEKFVASSPHPRDAMTHRRTSRSSRTAHARARTPSAPTPCSMISRSGRRTTRTPAAIRTRRPNRPSGSASA